METPSNCPHRAHWWCRKCVHELRVMHEEAMRGIDERNREIADLLEKLEAWRLNDGQ